uniref:mannose-1-phosphate guanylyltransferase/mannose-6-phosphate isomerase n=1 Tax=Helicobacter rodentium TaxID=59617 RepID=UPI0025B73BA2
MTNIILCGGSGTRLFPLSRANFPKQFMKIFRSSGEESHSLFQLTLLRNSKVCQNSLIVSNQEQYFLCLDQLTEIKKDSKFLLESCARNTAAAIVLACLELPKEEIVLVTPSDHLIKDEKTYYECVQRAQELAQDGFLVTFGIQPSSPEVGFGYIKANGENVESFKEKPDLKTAQMYVESKNYYWNSGMFLFQVETLINECKAYAQEIYESCLDVFKNATRKNNAIYLNNMEKIPENSIDYAIMEKSKNVKVVPSGIAWSDVGSFDSLFEEFQKDESGNAVEGNVVLLESSNNFIYSNNPNTTIATIGLEDYIVVDTGDCLLISKKGDSQKVKDIVSVLKNQGEICKNHLTTFRPWGSYTILDSNFGYKIKRIVVSPGKRLSLQKHFHRNEHWIVVSGTASVEKEGETMLVRPNESLYIKMGEVHRLSNEGKIPVVLIEAQVGEYTGEDDMVRIEDDFN